MYHRRFMRDGAGHTIGATQGSPLRTSARGFRSNHRHDNHPLARRAEGVAPTEREAEEDRSVLRVSKHQDGATRVGVRNGRESQKCWHLQTVRDIPVIPHIDIHDFQS